MSQTMDSKVFYGNLFKADKKPTKILDALLRGLAMYIVRENLFHSSEKSVSAFVPELKSARPRT